MVGVLCGNQLLPVKLYDESIEVRQMLQERSRLFLKNNVLYRVRKMQTGEQEQLVLPYRLRGEALHGMYDDVGHLGVDFKSKVISDLCKMAKIDKTKTTP